MKQILIALVLAFTTCALVNAQNQTTIVRDSIGKVKITVTKNKKDGKTDTKNTAVTVVGVDTADTDSIDQDSTNHSSAQLTFDSDDSNFPFENFGKAVESGIIISIVAIIAVFGLPVFILAIVFFFRYKNRKARYRLAEQALAAGQPLPADFIKEHQPTDQHSQGIKNTFTGIGLFIFLWAITGELGIGSVGLLVMFMGIGQWIIGNKQEQQKKQQPQSPIYTARPATQKTDEPAFKSPEIRKTEDSIVEPIEEPTEDSAKEKNEENK